MLRAWMGPEDDVVENRASNNAVEYLYPDRGLTFVNYFLEGQAYNAIRITEF